jgi:hypothetical protein
VNRNIWKKLYRPFSLISTKCNNNFVAIFPFLS